MDIKENFGNDRQISEKISGFTNKTTYITSARFPKLSNLALNWGKDIVPYTLCMLSDLI